MPAQVHTHKTRWLPQGLMRQRGLILPLRASQVAGKNKHAVSPTSKTRHAITQTHTDTHRHTQTHTNTHKHTHTHTTFSKPCHAKRAFYPGKTLKSQRKHDPSRGFSLSKTCRVFHTYSHVWRTVRFSECHKTHGPLQAQLPCLKSLETTVI